MRFNKERPLSRRECLNRCGIGIGSLGLTMLMQDSDLLSSARAESAVASPLAVRPPHFAARAKRVIHIFPEGGPSQVDTFDPKPLLEKYHDRPVAEVLPDYLKNAPEVASDMGRLSGTLQRSGFKFSKQGESEIEVSELFPHLSRHIDDLCVIRSMTTTSSVHNLAQLMMHNGEAVLPRPSMGAWTVYGLGAETQNLPAFIALVESGKTAAGDKTWSNAFLPNWSQGTAIDTSLTTVDRMIENIRSGSTSLREQRRQLDLLSAMNSDYAERSGQESAVEHRIRTFETAFRMQIEASEAFDLRREPASVHKLYGDSKQARQLMLARRLVERGVRFVQIWDLGWDTHDENDKRHRELCQGADQPLAALLEDLKQRDMLKDTLVIWGGEFGRTPTSDNNDVASKKAMGRDHNAGGFSMWMAGGGVKPGMTYGATDDLGAVAVEGKMDVHDLHATILHLLGLDHTKLTHRHAGRDFRLTDVHGRVIHDVLA